MRKSKKTPDEVLASRPLTTLAGVARIMGLDKATLYRRVRRGNANLSDLPQRITVRGTYYDLEAVYQRMLPGANDQTIALLMFDFIQDNGRLIR